MHRGSASLAARGAGQLLRRLQLRAMSSSSQVEVEAKLVATEKTQQLISQHCVKHDAVTLHDIYFDWRDLRLMSADHWLRRRNQQWELKLRSPAAQAQQSADQLVITAYREVTSAQQIHQALQQYMHCSAPTSNAEQALQWLTQHGGLKAFIDITTDRQCWTLNHGAVDGVRLPVQITLDRATFTPPKLQLTDNSTQSQLEPTELIEVETMLPTTASADEHTEAKQTIEKIARLLQLQPIYTHASGQPVSKVERALAHYHPQAYRHLQALNVFPKQPDDTANADKLRSTL